MKLWFSTNLEKCILLVLMVAAASLPFSTKICHGALIVLIAIMIGEGHWRKKWEMLRQNFLLHIYVLFFGITLIGIFFSDDINRGIFDIEKKIFLLLVPVVLGTSMTRLKRNNIRIVFYTLTASCIVGSLYCLYAVFAGKLTFVNYLPADFNLLPIESSTWLLYSYVALSKAIGLHPTYFSLYIAVSIVFLYFELTRRTVPRHTQALIVFAGVYLLIILGLLSSRIVIFSMITIVLLALAQRIIYQPKFSQIALLTVMLVLVSSTIIINPISRYRSIRELQMVKLDNAQNKMYDHSADIRFSLWRMSLEAAKNMNPIFGYGTGDVTDAVKLQADRNRITNVLKTNDPHNQYSYSLLSNGLPGLITLCALLFHPMFLFWRAGEHFPMIVLALFAMACFTESMLELQKGIVFLSIVQPMLCFHFSLLGNLTTDKKLLDYAK